MLQRRILTASALIAAFVLLAWLDSSHNFGRPGIWLGLLWVVATFWGAMEVRALLAAQNLFPRRSSSYGGVLLVAAATLAPVACGSASAPNSAGVLGWSLSALALAITWAFVAEMRRYDHPGGVIVHVALAAFIVVYLGLFGSFFVALRIFHDNLWGMLALVSLVGVVKMSDVGAYFVGRWLGRNKLAPKLSPGKTVEGALGGFASAAMVSWFLFNVAAPWIVGPEAVPLVWWRWLGFSIVVSAFGLIGDLSESLLKRDMQRKDSGDRLPGFGGVLDVLDSPLMAAPPAYLCWAIGLVGPGSNGM